MSRKGQKFYVTTPIYYVTAKPHLGSLYSTVIADVLARWHAMRGSAVFFLTGTDEHGQKIADAAQAAKKTEKEFVDSFIPAYKTTWKRYNIDYSIFMRTTEKFHHTAVQKLIEKLVARGDVYKSVYEGWYCVSCETFVATKSESEAPLPCTSCGRTTSIVSEESYFFKLSAYQKRLLDFYEQNPDFIVPQERTAEILQFVKAGLKDLSISRTTVSWGIPFPGDPKHTIYVWVEALCNYATAVGFLSPQRAEEFALWWPADVHVIGKDIVRFHAVYWPALLMAAGVALPKQLLVHGWLTVDGQKMSKSRGNMVDPDELADRYHVDAIRYYLLRYLPISHDGDFSFESLEAHINADLADDLGNLLQRVTGLALRSDLETLPSYFSSALSQTTYDAYLQMIVFAEAAMSRFEFHIALSYIWVFIKEMNIFLHLHQPWKHAKENKAFCAEILWIVARSLHAVALLLMPFMPEKMEMILFSLGVDGFWRDVHVHTILKGTFNRPYTLTQIPVLFEKIEKKVLPQKDQKTTPEVEKVATMVSIDTVRAVELRVGTITACTVVQKSTKLLLLIVDFGSQGEKQIVSGIREWYTPEQLIGIQALFVYNLQPREVFGIQSHGMILVAADETGKKQLVSPKVAVKNGSLLQ